MKSRSAALTALFCLSGAAALIYEVTWSRMLSLVLGTNVHAVSTVLASFFLGLALGSFLFGRAVGRVRDPARLFALLEAGIGLYALAVPALFGWIERAYVALAQGGGIDSSARTPVQFALAFTVLLVPTTLMGGTFPVLIEAVCRGRARAGRAIALLYGANTAGAVLGTFAAGFVLLPVLGVRASILVAVGLNLSVAALGLLLLRGGRECAGDPAPAGDADRCDEKHPESGAPPHGLLGPALLATSGAAGFCALGCEVLWTRGLVFFVGFSVYAFAAMLSVFLLGFSLGGWLVSAFIDRIRHRLAALGVLETLVGLAVVGSLGVLARLPEIIQVVYGPAAVISTVERTVFMFLVSALVILPATVAMGAAYPLFVSLYIDAARTPERCGARPGSEAGGSAGRIVAVNTIGGTLGAVVTGFLLIDILGIAGGIVALGCGLCAVGGLLVVACSELSRRVRLAIVVGGAVLVGFSAASLSRGGPLVDLSAYSPGLELLSYEEDPTTTVSVLGRGDVRVMTINATAIHREVDLLDPDPISDFYNGHVPMLLHPAPRDVMQIGMGTAITLGSIGVHPVERITAVEICAAVPPAARLFERVNLGILDDPRLRVVINDARNQLLVESSRYDVIVSDVWLSIVTGVSPLTTVEFFKLVRARLKPGGIYVPGPGLLDEFFRAELRTLLRVFDHAYLFAFPEAGTFLVVVSPEPLRVDYPALRRRFADPGVAERLAAIHLAKPEDLLAAYVCGTECVRAYAGLGPVDTDDLPTTAYNTPLVPSLAVRAPREFGFPADEARRLLALAESPLGLLQPSDAEPELASRLKRSRTAADALARARFVTDHPAAELALYQRAIDADPGNMTALAFLEAFNRPAEAPPAPNGPGREPPTRLRAPRTRIGGSEFDERSSGNSTGAGWVLWTNGHLRTRVFAARERSWTLRLRARGDISEGEGPRVTVLVDAREVAVFHVDVAELAEFSTVIHLPAGEHDVWLLFSNDHVVEGSSDRNLYLEEITFSELQPPELAQAR